VNLIARRTLQDGSGSTEKPLLESMMNIKVLRLHPGAYK
jgi:hypothetical protein